MNNYKPLKNNFNIRSMLPSDWSQVRLLYLEGIATQNATFETTAPTTWEEWDATHLPHCRFVAENNEHTLLGWVMLSPVSRRRVFSGVAEVSIYVSHRAQRRGVGYQLLSTLITESERQRIWSLQAGILVENLASLALHKKCGFREIGFREKVSQLRGKWRDLMLLERRSKNLC